MRRITFTLLIVLLFAGNLPAQTPDAFQYQAVVRDSDGNARANEPVTLDIAIIQGSANGSTVYSETHEPTTNGAGLVTLEIGGGSSGDSFTAIDWSDGPWFIEVSVDGTEMGTSQLLSVPFAKYADQAGNTFSGSYDDLSDVPANIDEDASDDFSGAFPDLSQIPQHLDTDSTDDFSGDYNDLTSLPDMDLKLDTAATDGWDKDTTDDFSGSYGDLTGRPTAISEFTLGAAGGRITSLGEPANSDDAATKAYVDTAAGSAGWSLTGNTGIDPSSQFLGTTDGQPLVFKVNSTERMRLDTTGSLVFPNSGGSIFIGSGAGENDDLANNQNIFIGDSTGFTNLAGSRNTALGYGVMYSNTYGYSNTATGYQSMYSNTGGDFNTAHGYEALYSNTTGGANTSVGYRSLSNNENGVSNTAMGYRTLNANTSGSYNAAGGSLALFDNTTGTNNTAFGYRAAQNNTIGDNNIAIGMRALYNNEVRSELLAIGDSALFNNNVYGSSNIGIGSNALYSNTSGGYNTALGYNSMRSNTTGYHNAAFGFRALRNNLDGASNTAFGSRSLYSNTSGGGNTAIGTGALVLNEDGSSNVAVGNSALRENVSGLYNTAIGVSSGPDNNDGLINTGAFGYSATVTSSNTVRIGNSNIIQIGGAVGWSNLSDGRFKTNVTPDVPGLDFILKLRPVTFNWDLDALDRFHGRDRDGKGQEESPAMKKARREKQQKVYTGFVAQQVEEAAGSIGFDFSGIRKPANDQSTYNLSYAEFVVPLVKAAQEQQEVISRLEEQLKAQKEAIEKQQRQIEKLLDELENPQ